MFQCLNTKSVVTLSGLSVVHRRAVRQSDDATEVLWDVHTRVKSVAQRRVGS